MLLYTKKVGTYKKKIKKLKRETPTKNTSFYFHLFFNKIYHGEENLWRGGGSDIESFNNQFYHINLFINIKILICQSSTTKNKMYYNL